MSLSEVHFLVVLIRVLLQLPTCKRRSFTSLPTESSSELNSGDHFECVGTPKLYPKPALRGGVQLTSLPVILSSLTNKWAARVLAVAVRARAAVSGGIAVYSSRACVAHTLLVPAVAQTLDIVALVSRMVARLVTVGL